MRKKQLFVSVKNSLGHTLTLLENLVVWGKPTITAEKNDVKEILESNELIKRLLNQHLKSS